MSIQNPERVVTKQDLADFYEQILPYLGGMPEVLANKFSKGDMYSADEKMIGQWIDGKPLYQKVLNVSISIQAQTWYEASSIDTSGIETFVKCIGFLTSNNHVFNIDDCQCVDNHMWFYNSCQATLDKLLIQYTKTADSPISIGNDTDYSTDEKIIGTWIDGKPLCQKTINTGALQGGQDNQILHGISNFDALINCFGIAYRGTNRIGVPMPHVSRTSLNWSLSCGDFSSTSFYIEAGTDYSGQYAIVDSYVTLQYTKTS